LREKKVFQLNWNREALSRLHYRSKYILALEMLVELSQLLPKVHQVYILFDSWYASVKLIKFCSWRGWQVICTLKKNRRINKKRINQYEQWLKHKRYQGVMLNATEGSQEKRNYFVCTICGHLEDVPEEAYVLISKRHPGDKYPNFFACTDLNLFVQQILSYYQKRRPEEIDNFHLKEALGLGEFR
jgi:hypothetical protein